MLFHLYTDFRNYSSLAQLQAIGWTGQTVMGGNPSISYGNNGITLGTQSMSYGGIYKKLPFALTNQHKIIVKQTGYGRGPNQAFVSLGSTDKSNLQYSNERDCGLNIPFGNRNNNNNINIGVSTAVNGTKRWGIFELTKTVATGETGEYSMEMEIDLKNQTAKRTVYSPSLIAGTMSGTLNTDGYNAILGMEYAHFRAGSYENPQIQNIYTGEIIIKRA